MTELYRPERGIITRGIAGLWTFKDGVGGQFLFDQSSNARDGILGTTTSTQSTDPTWNQEGLLFANGSSQQVIFGDLSAIGGTPTIMAVAKPTILTGSRGIMGYYGFSATPFVAFYLRNNAGNWGWGVGATDNTLTTGSFGAVTSGLWVCLAITFDGSNVNAYINNAAPTTVSVVKTMKTTGGTGDSYIGRDRNGGTDYWEGTIAYTMIYNRPLGRDEIYANYRALQGIMSARGIGI